MAKPATTHLEPRIFQRCPPACWRRAVTRVTKQRRRLRTIYRKECDHGPPPGPLPYPVIIVPDIQEVDWDKWFEEFEAQETERLQNLPFYGAELKNLPKDYDSGGCYEVLAVTRWHHGAGAKTSRYRGQTDQKLKARSTQHCLGKGNPLLRWIYDHYGILYFYWIHDDPEAEPWTIHSGLPLINVQHNPHNTHPDEDIQDEWHIDGCGYCAGDYPITRLTTRFEPDWVLKRSTHSDAERGGIWIPYEQAQQEIRWAERGLWGYINDPPG